MFRGVNFKQRVFYLIVILLILAAFFIILWSDNDESNLPPETDSQETTDSQIIASNVPLPLPSNENCRMHTNDCFNIYRCGYNEDDKISVYIYPFINYFDEKGAQISPSFSKEFYDLVTAIKESKYYTSNMEKACIIVPPLDMLNQRRIKPRNAGQILSSLPSWRQLDHGKNHLIFNMFPGQHPDFNTSLDVETDKALLGCGGFSSWSYRPTFDISIPVFNSLTRLAVSDESIQNPSKGGKKWFLLSTQVNYNAQFRSTLEKIASLKTGVLVLNRCLNDDKMYSRCYGNVQYKYPHVLQSSTFCMVIRGVRLGQTTLLDILMMGCIPVIIADNYVLPFSEVIDWARAAVIVREDQIADVYMILMTYTSDEITDMKKQVKHLWVNYFSSMKTIALTTIKIINDRVFPNAAWSYEDWNTPNIPSTGKAENILHPPFTIPLISPKQKGFTAVVLTYDRVSMLFRVLKQLVQAPSLAKIVVVWNNVNKAPPLESEWPKLSKPIEVIETKANKLSNRFFPYNEIETEAIFSLDDDIVMLTGDEIQFAFEVWLEYPDRLVGFPGRLHTSGNSSSRLKYESEWLNDVSMVLTGASFHHKYFSQVFTYMMPATIRRWVDKHMNCEDIAMNFLVANYTGKAPIKVTPRKRFKCPECAHGDALGPNHVHFVERSLCIQEFVKFFGKLPLKTAEFRADPVLHQHDVPSRIKRFKNIGTI
ncbi:exostosin-2-like isoform X2 [Dendronephthya gigantea]|uniref:exostosin-2-like isoform X2 n=1 Tax=Dendronephthya gigantea TaxID=151771 RepID=UPI00106A0346|nr:exostosin-2-like isoform X2 [Dendronephthya gigantea]